MTASEQIIEVLDAICAKFGIAIDWTSTNVIPYITTLITNLVSFEIWSSVAYMGFAVLPIVLYIVFIKKTWANNHDDIDYAAPVTIGAIFVIGGCCLVITTQIIDIIKCVTFPEMFVYEYVLNFMKNMN